MDFLEVRWEHGLDRCGLLQGKVAGSCECGNEPMDSPVCGEFFD
jgi:hypothetical protein